jgi:hypothetical protein
MSSQQRYRPHHKIDVHSAGSTVLDTTGYLLSRRYRINLEIKCPLSRRYCTPHSSNVLSAEVPYRISAEGTVRITIVNVLATGGTLHITRVDVFSAGGTGTVHLTRGNVFSAEDTVHIT